MTLRQTNHDVPASNIIIYRFGRLFQFECEWTLWLDLVFRCPLVHVQTMLMLMLSFRVWLANNCHTFFGVIAFEGGIILSSFSPPAWAGPGGFTQLFSFVAVRLFSISFHNLTSNPRWVLLALWWMSVCQLIVCVSRCLCRGTEPNYGSHLINTRVDEMTKVADWQIPGWWERERERRLLLIWLWVIASKTICGLLVVIVIRSGFLLGWLVVILCSEHTAKNH